MLDLSQHVLPGSLPVAFAAPMGFPWEPPRGAQGTPRRPTRHPHGPPEDQEHRQRPEGAQAGPSGARLNKKKALDNQTPGALMSFTPDTYHNRCTKPCSNVLQSPASAAMSSQSPPTYSTSSLSYLVLGLPAYLPRPKSGRHSRRQRDQRLSVRLAVFPANLHFRRRYVIFQYSTCRSMILAERFMYSTHSSNCPAASLLRKIRRTYRSIFL